jgi:hypothetical protein
MPVPIAIIMKKTGRESERAARTSVERRPPKKVSTTLYMVLKKNPTLVGTARCRIRWGIGSVVS